MSAASLRRRVGFDEGDRVIAAFAEYVSGPGWANHPLRVLVMSRTQELRFVWIQPDDFSGELHAVYPVAAAAVKAITSAARSLLKDYSE